ncbi:hypothetical protein WJX81_002953 [Elliptochloris bilobata]|uniref:26S proteasome non-ATPase regulatory subunit 4 homolog n=1 Tax=Elliptochloris bilobata TaxID=381761 RepID=A0AAW1QL94_9CHLO
MEATVVCVDNSEWTRNGDYAPTRFQAQADAVNLLAGAKTQANPENTVGVLTMAGKTPRVLVTPTPDLGRVLNSMQALEIEGEANLSSAVQIAQLALKHRQNKNQRQRIVLFVGSPIREDKATLVKIAKKLKKNNVAVDVVAFGSEGEEANTEKLEAFREAVNSGDNSHLVTVPAGTVLSDMLFSSPIFQVEGGAGYGAPAGGAEGGGVSGGYDFGVDPNLDPELALALRVSMEEERARQSAAAAATIEDAGAAGSSAAAAEGAAGAAPVAAAGDEAEAMDEDALLQQALAMSMQADQSGGGKAPAAAPAPAPAAPAADQDMALDAADDELQRALQMSMAGEGEASAAPAAGGGAPGGVADMLGDSDYLASVLGSLPGVDPSDPALQGALASLNSGAAGGGS